MIIDFICFSIALSTMTRSNLERKGLLYLTICSPSCRQVRAGITKEQCLLVCLHSFPSLLFYTTEYHMLTVGLAFPHQPIIQKCSTDQLQASQMKAFSQLRFSSQMTVTCAFMIRIVQHRTGLNTYQNAGNKVNSIWKNKTKSFLDLAWLTKNKQTKTG